MKGPYLLSRIALISLERRFSKSQQSQKLLLTGMLKVYLICHGLQYRRIFCETNVIFRQSGCQLILHLYCFNTFLWCILCSPTLHLINYLIFHLQIEAPIFASLVSGFDYIESSNRKILNYGWVNFPLAYVEVATISVYVYLLASLFGCQFLGIFDFIRVAILKNEEKQF